MELVVLLLVISVGLNVLLGFKAVKLSNKVDSAEIVASEYKNKADYWYKQYEANNKALPYEKLKESHTVISEAFEELQDWYKEAIQELNNALEDYDTLAEQYGFVCDGYDDAFLDSTLSHAFLNHHRLLVDFELFKVNYIRADNGLENITMEQFRDDYRCSADFAFRRMGISLIRDID